MMDIQSQPSQKGPADLTKILNPNCSASPMNGSPGRVQDDQRDSAYFSSTDASSSKRTLNLDPGHIAAAANPQLYRADTSAASFGVGSILSPAGSGYHSAHDKTPSPIAPTQMPHPLISPSTSNMSVASIVSPTTPGSADPRRFDRPTSIESNGMQQYGDALLPGQLRPDSRRESVDSRINQRFDDMRLNGSPYASHNHSTTSFHQSAINAQRTARPGIDSLAVHRISNGYQPSNDRNPDPLLKTVKTAPAITGPATGTIARAAEPTKGQAWAFPEEEIQRIGPSYLDSRRSSMADSLASSQFTTESRLPPGQRRLDDGSEYGRLSTDLPPVHHHTLQHKQLSDLQQDDSSSVTGQQPYSRTPELRISHKLAERKRRTEMKELFDQLRDLMPQERGSKASKWEILTKAISEHQKQSDHIRMLQSHYNTAATENEMMRQELQKLRMENSQLRSDMSASVHPPNYGQDHYSHTPRTEQLPPLRSLSNSLPGAPDAMTGIQYDTPRVNVNGYRQ
jgi:hypothetical protein